MGGEKLITFFLFFSSIGSPPRGRGKDREVIRVALRVGITPAWAGKSFSFQRIKKPPGDHPRVGGEKAPFHRALLARLGSPPRGRGKVDTISNNSRARRITPAWAGKSGIYDSVAKCYWDHPRVGGEKTSADRPRIADIGSPPRGRGKVSSVSMCTRSPGITPA